MYTVQLREIVVTNTQKLLCWSLGIVFCLLAGLAWNKLMPSALSIMKEGDARVLEDAATGNKTAQGYLKADKPPFQGTVEHYRGVGQKYKEKFGRKEEKK